MKKINKKLAVYLLLSGALITSTSLAIYFYANSQKIEKKKKSNSFSDSQINGFEFNIPEKDNTFVPNNNNHNDFIEQPEKSDVKFYNFQFKKSDVDDSSFISLNFEGTKLLSESRLQIELEDNNKNLVVLDKFKINNENKEVIFDTSDLTNNRKFNVKTITLNDQLIKNDNDIDDDAEKISFSTIPSNTFIDFENSRIIESNENSATIEIELKTQDNIKEISKSAVSLSFAYKNNNSKNYLNITGILNKKQDKIFITANLNNLIHGESYFLEKAKFISKPKGLFYNINNNYENAFYDFNKSNNKEHEFVIHTDSETLFKNNSKFEFEVIGEMKSDPFENDQNEIKYHLSGVVLDKRKIDFSKINENLKLKFSKVGSEETDVYASKISYDPNENKLSFEIENSNSGDQFILKEIQVKNNETEQFENLDITNVDKKLIIEYPISKSLEVDLINSRSWESSLYPSYVFINLKLKNNWNDEKIEKLLDQLTKDDYSESKKNSIKNVLANIIYDNYKKIVKNNNVDIDNKIIILRLSDPADDSNFYSQDNNIFYFLLNETNKHFKNTKDIDEKWDIVNNSNTISISMIKNPFISNNRNGTAIENDHFKIKRLSSETLFAHNEDGSHSYRIPNVTKLKNGKILSVVDKRVENISDYNNSISQVFKESLDGGKTWSQNKEILKIAVPKKNNRGIAIDGIITEIEYFDEETQTNKTKLHFIVDIFPGTNTGVPHLSSGNPWFYIGDQGYLKMWTKLNNRNNFDSRSSVLKRVEGRGNWFRRYILPAGVSFNNNFTASTQLEETNTYVDMNYHQDTKSISGRVYENVMESDFDDPMALDSKKTEHSVFDEPRKVTNVNNNTFEPLRNEHAVYALAINSHLATLESYDEGRTWTNLQWIDEKLSRHRNNHKFVGTGVGNGIQLKHQANASINGRVIIPMYSMNNNDHYMFFIYSDDKGKTWTKYTPNGFKTNLSESSFVETEDGTLYWFARHTGSFGQNTFRTFISKSTDGGMTWSSPDNDTSRKGKDMQIGNPYDANIFSGIDHFRWKNKDYFIFSLSKSAVRRNGYLFIADATFENIVELFRYDDNQREHFAYSYALVTNKTENYIDFISIYEASERFKIIDGGFDNSRPKGGEIQLDKFRLWIKD
ncbi:hypothetical protein MCANPG14_00438 [Mycoplasmopsis canis PG 14]|uniref:exo-alpha-sialidase n=1 Tax=Mycoplasmopsis canis TaxID=29555 RepID=H2EV89_9BACT|nr:sialidase family protein [Mycoplasmopsis canis]AEX30834.1 sialidase [Mycoplasmopsis canis]AMD81374.1 hypothetical protein AXW82_02325 [Mycoplasmopsis canis PG 14]EIE40847.1 hypothetical protein MCANPG14_00438 [Mycoplasmopsis canis PG 14]VEU68648.1 Sialidase A precursor [Mycoplasmopsis canis]